MALTLYKTHNEIIDKLKKLSPADSDDWILRFHDGPSKKEKKKTCVACVAKKPDDPNSGELFPASGTFVLFLEKSDYKICKFEKRDATFPGINDIDFNGKSFQELCKRNEWPTIDLILETACRVEQTSAELTFSLNGLSIFSKVSTLSSLGSNEPVQLFCEVLKVCTDTHPPQQSTSAASIARTVSLMDSSSLQQQQPSTSGICDMNENKLKNFPQLNRTISVPCDGSVNPSRIPSNCFLPSPPTVTIPTKSIGSQKRKEKRLDSIIDSVATNSNIEMFSSPPLPSSSSSSISELPSSMMPMGPPQAMFQNRRKLSTAGMMGGEEKGSVLKSLLQNPSSAGTLGLPPGYQMQQPNISNCNASNNYGYAPPTQQLTLRQNSFDAGTMLSAESTGFEIANFGVFSPKDAAKKKRVRNPAGTKKLTNSRKQQKDLEIQQRQLQQQASTDMFQTAGYPQAPAQNGFPSGSHAGMTPQQYAQAQQAQQHQMMRQQHQQQQAAAAAAQQHQQAMFNPNMPSSSRAGQMSSSAMMQQMNHHQGMGHPMNMYPNGAQMTSQQQMQMQSQGQMMQHGNPAGWNNSMYHQQQQQQQHANMFPYGHPNRPYMSQHPAQQHQPPQAPPPATTAKKTAKRKNAKANQEQQQQATAVMHQQAATSQPHQPPNKQQYLNPMYSGSPQFSSPSTPMNHVSPFHQQHAAAAAAAAAQQQQQHFEWSKNGGINRPNSRSEQVRADLRATIQTRQNTSPPQMGAILSPNEQLPARFSGPNSSSSPMTMMSPPRVSQGPHPGHASASNYAPGSIPQPSSAEHQTNLFSPKQQNGFYNNYPNGMHQQQPQQQHQNPHSINSQQQQQNMSQMQAQHHHQLQQQQLHLQQQQQHQQQQLHQHQQQMQVLEELKAFPAVTLDDCKEILQEDGYGDLDVVGFDMMTKQGFEFNYDESRALLQRILY